MWRGGVCSLLETSRIEKSLRSGAKKDLIRRLASYLLDTAFVRSVCGRNARRGRLPQGETRVALS